MLVVAWGGTFGVVTSAVRALQDEGFQVSSLHLRHLNPLPNDLCTALHRFKRVIVPELNHGQLCLLVRARCLVDAHPLSKLKGRPFKVAELREAILNLIPA